MSGISEELAQEAQQRSLELQTIAEQAKPSKNGHKSRVAKEIDKSQLGIADRFAEAHKNDFKYVDGIGWFAWNGKHWEQNESLGWVAVRSVVEKYLYDASDMEKQASILDNEDAQNNTKIHQSKIDELKKDAKEYRALAKKHLKDSGISEIQRAARNNQMLRARIDSFDKNKMLLNCSNCTVNLATGEQMLHNRTDLITKIISTEYKPDATCSTWLKFLDDIMINDVEMIDYLQRIVGLCLTGMTENHNFFVFHGNGKNGKSTFLKTIEKLMGCYAETVKTDLLLRGGLSNAHSPTEEIAKLLGARLAIASESDQGKKLSESIIKQMTGGDSLTARRLHQKPFRFTPEFKLFLMTNNRPDVDGTDEGIWRRIKLIPFLAEFKDGKADLMLSQKLEAELPGILAWAVQGLHKYLADDGTGGLIEPEKVKKATQNYRDEQNVFSAFLRLDLVPKMAPTVRGFTVETIQNKFNAWAQKEGVVPLLLTEVSKELKKLGWTEIRLGKEGHRIKVPPAHWRTTSAENENLSAIQS